MFFGKKSDDDQMLGEIDIQTMGDDLQKKSAPATAPAIPQPTKATTLETEPASIKFENAPQKTEPQPFLKQNFDLGKKLPSESVNTIEKSNPFFEEKRGSAPVYIKENVENKPGNGINFGKILIIVGVILLISLIAGGGYFFWLNTRQAVIVEAPPLPETPISEPVVEPTPIPELVPTAPEIPKPRYMNIDINNLTAIQIKEKITGLLQAILNSPSDTVIEYVVSDLNNNPIGFKSFSSKLGLAFSPAALADLSDQFSLYLYNDNGNAGLGLAVDIINDSKLKTDFKKEEPNLVKDLNPLLSLIGSTIINKKIVFAVASYKNIDDNYFNIISKEKLSIDYGVGYKKLIIGTTMMTFRKVVDSVETAQNSQATIPPVVPVSPTTPSSPSIQDSSAIPTNSAQ